MTDTDDPVKLRRSREDTEADDNREFAEKAYRDPKVLRKLYYDEKRSTVEMADLLDCSQSSITTWMNKYGLERRSGSEAIQMAFGTENEVPLHKHHKGPMMWRYHYKDEKADVMVHRLLAVAKYGFDALEGKVVHHKNEIPWDNRPDNITLMEPREHRSHHRTYEWLDMLGIAEMYLNTPNSSHDLEEAIEPSNPTICRIARTVQEAGEGFELEETDA
jgi:hypothetical protein